MPQSKAHIDATRRYEKKAYDHVQLRVRKDAEINGDFIRAYAESRGESVNAFMLRAVTETIARDKERMEQT